MTCASGHQLRASQIIHWGRDKMAANCLKTISHISIEQKYINCDEVFLYFVSIGPINNVGPDNGLAPARRQAIIWTNAGKLIDAYMRHSASMSWGVPSMMLVRQSFRNGATIWCVIYDWEGIGQA